MNKQEVNIEAIEKELDAQFAVEEPASEEPVETTEEVSETQEQEPEVQSDPEENVETVDEDSTEEPETEPAVNDPNEHKRNDAFKKLREERDKLAESDKFLGELATQYGLTKEQLIQRYKDEADKKQAQKEGMTPEQYKKMNELQKEVEEIKENRRKEIFNYEAQKVSDKFNLSDKQMVELFDYASASKIDILNNPALLEFAYRAKNYDNAVEQGRQKQLETSKQRRAKSVGQTGTKKSTVPVDERKLMEAEIDAYLKEQKIIK